MKRAILLQEQAEEAIQLKKEKERRNLEKMLG